MSNILLLLAHPDIENSIGNKTIINAVNTLKNVVVRDLTALYPDFNIDIDAEQMALTKADLIILQYPVYWYNMPPILKQWFDKVLTYGFAFGTGSVMTNKAILASVTLGSPESSYPDGELERLLLPIQASAKFCKLNYLKPIASYGIYYMPNRGEMDLKPVLASAETHAAKLKSFITNFKLN